MLDVLGECGGEYAAGSGTAFGSGEFMVPESSQEAGPGCGGIRGFDACGTATYTELVAGS